MKGTYSRTVSLPKEVWADIELYAEMHGYSLSYVVNRMVSIGLDYFKKLELGEGEKVFDAKPEA